MQHPKGQPLRISTAQQSSHGAAPTWGGIRVTLALQLWLRPRRCLYCRPRLCARQLSAEGRMRAQRGAGFGYVEQCGGCPHQGHVQQGMHNAALLLPLLLLLLEGLDV